MPTPDVRVRLSAEGVQDVVNAFNKVRDSSGKASKGVKSDFQDIGSSLSGLKNMLMSLGAAFVSVNIAQTIKDAAMAGETINIMAKRFAMSTEDVSAVGVALRRVGGDLDTASRAMTQLFIKTSQASRDLSSPTAKILLDLKLTTEQIKAFGGQDLGARIEIIGGALAKLADTAPKTAAEVELLGARGTKLLPIFEKVSKVGFAGLRADAAALSSLMDKDMIAAAERFDDALDDIQIQTQGLATIFVSGLSGPVVGGLQGMQWEANRTAGGLHDLGAAFGWLAGASISAWTIATDAVVTFWQTVGKVIADVARLVTTPLKIALVLGDPSLDWKEKGEKIKGIVDDAGVYAESLGLIVQKNWEDWTKRAQVVWDKFQEGASNKPREGRVMAGPSQEEVDAYNRSAQAREREEREREAAEKKRERLVLQRLDVEQEIMKAQGETHALTLKQIDEEVERRRAALKELGEAPAEIERQTKALRDALTAQEAYNEAQRQMKRALDQLDRDRKRIEADQKAGLISQEEANQRILALEQERKATLEGLADAQIAAAAAAGGEDRQIEAAKQKEEIDNLGRGVSAFKQDLQEATTSGLQQFLDTGVMVASTVGEAFKSMALSIVSAIQQVIAQVIALGLVKSLFKALNISTGGPAETVFAQSGVNAAQGGLIRGPGTGTSDSIPAMLSNMEYIMPAHRVAQPGMLSLLEDIRSGRLTIGPIHSHHVTKFAEGGLATKSAFDGSMTIGLDPGLIARELDSPQGHQFIVKAIAKNRNAITKALRG